MKHYIFHPVILLCFAGLTHSTVAQSPNDLAPVPPATLKPHTVVVEKELIMTNVKVVESSRAKEVVGPWHIRTLFSNMIGGAEPSQLMLQWLGEWEEDRTVNGLVIPKRPRIRELVIDPWLKASGMAGKPASEVQLKWSAAPFRLLAIVNRFDLAQADPMLDRIDNAGEGRFVFGVTSDGPDGPSVQFTVIFEYRQRANSKKQFEDWAKAWHALGDETLGKKDEFPENYLSALEAITTKFSGPGAALHQLRTNEIVLQVPWELREFQVEGNRLVSVTVKQNPDISFNQTSVLDAYLKTFILDVPPAMPSGAKNVPFLAASSINEKPVWNLSTPSQDAKLKKRLADFAKNTCNGCHGVEGGMIGREFTQVQPREPGQESILAGFLTGKAPAGQSNEGAEEFTDPRDSQKKIPFANDLGQRKTMLMQVAEPGTVPSAAGEPLWNGRKGRVH